MWLEIVRRKALGSKTLFQLEDDEGHPHLPVTGLLLRSPLGTYLAAHKPEYGDWCELRVVTGELPKSRLEIVGSEPK